MMRYALILADKAGTKTITTTNDVGVVRATALTLARNLSSGSRRNQFIDGEVRLEILDTKTGALVA